MIASTKPVAAPTTEAERLLSLDVLRGFALCGILLMNISFMGGTFLSFHPVTPPSWADVNWRVHGVGELFVEGTMRGLFSLLFGAGVLLITARGMTPDGPVEVADVHYRRAMMLMLLGAIQFTLLLWPGEILFTYGFVSLFLFPLRRLAPKILAAIAAASILANAGFGAAAVLDQRDAHRAAAALAARQDAGQALSPQDAETAKEWREDQARRGAPDPAKLKAEAKARQGGYGGLVAWSTDTWARFVGKLGPMMFFDVFAFMCAGMALFKWGVLTGRRSLRLYVTMAVVGYGLGVPINAWQLWTAISTGFSPEGWLAQVTYDAPRLLVTLGHLGLILTLVKLNVLGFVGRALSNLGRMALTNYVGQSVIAAVIFYGLRQWGRLDLLQLWGVTAAIWVFQAIASGLWLRRYTMGPLEWVLRAVAYGRATEIRRGQAAPSGAPAAAE